MKQPLQKLKKGDTIGIICPSFAISPDSPRFEKMEKFLKEQGFLIRYGKTIKSKYSYLAGEDILRAKDLEEMFQDPSIQAVLCMLGGYGASRMVDLLDFELIRKHPKPLIGFSDVTVLLNAVYQKTGIPTLHGMVGVYLGNPNCDDSSYQDFIDALTKPQKNRILKNPHNQATSLIGGIVEGELVGGNLSLVHALMGTPYELDFKDKIVFLEDVEEEPYKIDRYMSTLRLANKLQEAKGFVFGYFTNCNPSESRKDTWSARDVVKDYVMHLHKPTLCDFATGHDFPFLNLWVGSKVQLDASEQTITLLEEIFER